jgi:hypothetical protein
MSKEESKKESTFAGYVAAICASGLAIITMAFLDISKPYEETSLFILQGLLYGCLFVVFNLFTSRFFKWVYS